MKPRRNGDSHQGVVRDKDVSGCAVDLGLPAGFVVGADDQYASRCDGQRHLVVLDGGRGHTVDSDGGIPGARRDLDRLLEHDSRTGIDCPTGK